MIRSVPFFRRDDDGDQCAAVRRLKWELQAAQGVMFVTSEYNRSIPGVLKNAIDHASRPYGKSAFAGNLGPDSRKFLQGWMDRYLAWVEKHAG